MSTGALRVLLLGATGALGTEVANALHERGFPLASLRPVASEDSLGNEVTVQGVDYPVESGEPDLRGIDLAFLCAPPSVSLDWVAEALRSRVPTIDMSGALEARDEVPLGVTTLHSAKDFLESPVIATPAGPSLGWLRVLLPLNTLNPIESVVATSLESVSSAGRAGITALSEESIALFSQSEPPESDEAPFSRPVAFDCVPEIGGAREDGSTEREYNLARVVERALGDEIRVAVTSVQVPTFAGDGSVLHLRFAKPLDFEAARKVLREAPSVLFDPNEDAPGTRSAISADGVRVGRFRPGSEPDTLQLWLAGDSLRLAALNAVELAAARQRLH